MRALSFLIWHEGGTTAASRTLPGRTVPNGGGLPSGFDFEAERPRTYETIGARAINALWGRSGSSVLSGCTSAGSLV